MKKYSNKFTLKTGLIGLLLVGLVILAGCSGNKETAQSSNNSTDSSKKVTLTIGYLPLTHSLPLFIADDLNKGKYKNVDLKLQKFSSWPELTEALNSGAIDGAVTMTELAMVSQTKGIDQQLLALSHRNGDVLTVATSINTVAELKGKTVAIPHRMSGQNILLNLALKQAGLKYSDVNIREMAPPDMPAALATGEISAYLVAEPFGTQSILNGKGKVLKKADDLWPNWICCGLVLNSKYINNNEAAVSEFVKSFVAAGRYIDTNQDKAITIAQKYTNIKKENWKESLKLITYNDLVPKKDEVTKVNSYLKEMGLLKQDIDVNKLVNTRYVEK